MKKNNFLIAIWLLLAIPGFAQNVGINTDASLPDPNAMLDVKSTNKGLLIPRMSTAARVAIPNTKGLLVYDTTTSSVWYNTGTQWQNMASPAALTSLSVADSFWSLNGNSNAVDGVNFLGTVNNVPLNIRVFNQPAGRLDPIRGNTAWGWHTDYSDTSGFDNTAVGAFAFQASTSGSYNVAIGNHTMYFNTTGSQNTALGVQAMSANTSGFNNTSVGYRSLFANTSSCCNTALGYQSMLVNTTGGANTAVGQGTLQSNTTGYNNTVAGVLAMYSNTTGFWNTATGGYAMYENGTGSQNTATGYQSLMNNTNGISNTATGFEALYLGQSGNNNTANGYQALYSTTGSNLTATGYQALYSNQSGQSNTADGYQALFANTNGRDNTATGYNALAGNLTGYSNTAAGSSALLSNTDGYHNVAFGKASLQNNTDGAENTALGGNTLFYNTTGQDNVAVGYQSGVGITTGSSNICLGAFSNVSSGDLVNATAIGVGAYVDASNKVRIGNPYVTVIEGQVPFTTPSDGRYKFHIREDVRGLDFILQLRPVTYQFDVQRFDAGLGHREGSGGQQVSYAMQAAYHAASEIRRTGFIAQEVDQAAKACGYDFSGIIRPKTEEDHYSLSYDAFVVPLVKAVQEQQQIIDTQAKKMQEQDKRIANLEEKLEALMRSVQATK